MPICCLVIPEAYSGDLVLADVYHVKPIKYHHGLDQVASEIAMPKNLVG